MKQQLVAELSGKAVEPKYNKLQYTIAETADALSWYAKHARSEDLKSYATTYCTKHLPALVKGLRGAPAWEFMTWGSMCRLVDRGFVFSDDAMNRLHTQLEAISASTKPESVAKPVVARQKRAKPNPSFEAFDYALDAVMYGEAPDFRFSAADNLNEILAEIKKMQDEMTSDPEQFDPALVKRVRKFLKEAEAKLTSAKVKVKTQTAVRARKVDPAKMVKAVKFAKSSTDLAFKPQHPVDLVGKRKCYVYDDKYRRLIVFVSTAAGFAFEGTTMKNVDLSKSFSKTVRKPQELFGTDRPSISDMNKAFEALTTKKTAMLTGRFNDYFSIIVHTV